MFYRKNGRANDGKTGKIKDLCGILLIASSITHVIQLFFVGFEWHDIGAAFIGSLYGILGILLIMYRTSKVITMIGILYPTFGGMLGLYRLINIEIAVHGTINWFIVWHVAVDIVVVLICIHSFLKIRK